MTGVLVLSDTHLRAGQEERLVHLLGPQLAGADVIVHAGDVVEQAVLDLLAGYAPLHAVLGNNDHGMVRPERIEVQIDGCTIAAVHDSGPSSGRTARLRGWFPAADVVLFGHSHLPWHETDVRADGHVQHHLNPGSAVQRRQAPHRTAAWVELDAGTVRSVEHLILP